MFYRAKESRHKNNDMKPEAKKIKNTYKEPLSDEIFHFDKTLHRTKPKGQNDPGRMCMDCIKKLHPELHKNIQEDKTLLESSIENLAYNKN